MVVYGCMRVYIHCKSIANMMKVVKVTLFDRIGSVCEGVILRGAIGYMMKGVKMTLFDWTGSVCRAASKILKNSVPRQGALLAGFRVNLRPILDRF